MLSAAKAARSHSSDGRQSEGAPPVALLLRGGERAARRAALLHGGGRAARRAALLHVGERVARRAALQHGGKLVTYQTVRCGLLHVLPAPRSRVSLLRPEGQLVQCCFGPRIGCRRGTAAHGVGGDTGGRRSDGSGNEHAVVVGGGAPERAGGGGWRRGAARCQQTGGAFTGGTRLCTWQGRGLRSGGCRRYAAWC